MWLVKIKEQNRWQLAVGKHGVEMDDAEKRIVLEHCAHHKPSIPAYAVPAPPAHPTAATEDELRHARVAWELWGVAHAAQIHYPPGDHRTQLVPLTSRLPQTVDCSEFEEWTTLLAGLPDPSGGNYREPVIFTGSMIANLKQVSSPQAKHGDWCILGPGTGEHVVGIVDRLPRGDFDVVSHGQEIGPLRTMLSQEIDAHGHTIARFYTLHHWTRRAA